MAGQAEGAESTILLFSFESKENNKGRKENILFLCDLCVLNHAKA
jgi:hypothetical protein